MSIGDELILFIERDLENTITTILDNTIPRIIQKVEIQVTTNLGEVKLFKFDDIKMALEFLVNLDEVEILNTDNSPSLIDNIEEVQGDEEQQ